MLNECDLIGRPIDDDDREILDVWRRLQRLARRTDLSPCVCANAAFAAAAIAQVVTDLGLEWGHDAIA